MSYSSTILGDAPTHYWRLNEGAPALAAQDLGSSKTILFAGRSYLFPAQQTNASGFGWSGPTSDGGSASFNQMWLHAEWLSADPTFDAVDLVVPGTLECWAWMDGAESFIEMGWIIPSLPLNQRLYGLQISTFRVGAWGNQVSAFFSRNTSHAWHHYAWVQDTTQVSVFQDGVQVAVTAVATTPQTSARYFGLGTDQGGAPDGRFAKCLLAEVATYSSALTSGQLTAHFNAADHVNAEVGFIGQLRAASRTATGWIVGPAHSGLTGTGEIVLTNKDAVQVVVNILPVGFGAAVDTPQFYFELGFVTAITAEGADSTLRINRTQQVFYMPPLATAISWSIPPTMVITITELSYSFATI